MMAALSPSIFCSERKDTLEHEHAQGGTRCLQHDGEHFLQAREYLGPGDPTQESLQYVLESTAAAGSCAHGLPYLPTGNLISGLPAALMSCCQVRPPLNPLSLGAASHLAQRSGHGGWRVSEARCLLLQ